MVASEAEAEPEPCVEVTLNPTVSDLMQLSEAEQVPITRFEAKRMFLSSFGRTESIEKDLGELFVESSLSSETRDCEVLET
jgi:hypothetical protein